MNTGLTASMAWLIGFCVLAEAAREVCFKQAANHTALFKAMMKPIKATIFVLNRPQPFNVLVPAGRR